LGTPIQRKILTSKADVRSLFFFVDLTRDGIVVPDADIKRQDFSMQTPPRCQSTIPGISGNHEVTHSIKPSRRPVVPLVPR
jgi:hypothetical protein